MAYNGAVILTNGFAQVTDLHLSGQATTFGTLNLSGGTFGGVAAATTGLGVVPLDQIQALAASGALDGPPGADGTGGLPGPAPVNTSAGTFTPTLTGDGVRLLGPARWVRFGNVLRVTYRLIQDSQATTGNVWYSFTLSLPTNAGTISATVPGFGYGAAWSPVGASQASGGPAVSVSTGTVTLTGYATWSTSPSGASDTLTLIHTVDVL
jgi:hypothetical protein